MFVTRNLIVITLLWLLFGSISAQNIMQTTLGGPGVDGANCIAKTDDGGYIIGGISNSYGAGLDDILIVKTGPAGNPIWSRTYGGSGTEYIRAIRKTADGGFVIAGHSTSFGSGDEALFFKISAFGVVQWAITLGAVGQDRGCDIMEFPWGGGFAICGSTQNLGPTSGGNFNFIGRLSSTGNLVWAKAFGGNVSQSLFGLNFAPDNTIVATGPTDSYGAGSFDFQIVKYDTSGNQIWYRTLGTTANEHSRTIYPMPGGGFLINGHTTPGISGGWDNLVVRTDGNGNVNWARAYGGLNDDMAMDLAMKANGGFAFSSYSQSGTLGATDVLIAQCDSLGSVQWRKVLGGAGNDDSPWGGKNIIEVSPSKYAVASGTNSFGPGNGDFYLMVVDSSIGNPCNEGTIPLATGPRIVLTSTFSPPSLNIPVVTPRILTTTQPTVATALQCRDTLAGIINTYTPVVSFDSCGIISVGSTSGFSVGDLVMIIQMKGASIDLTNTASFGTILNYNDAGNYELARISGIVGTSVAFQNSLIRTYDPNGLVQMVSIPEPTNPFIASTLTALPWNGSIGGVLALNPQGVMTLGANLDVSGTGFRGGLESLDFFSGCSSTGFVFPQPSTIGAQKGEGISDPGLAFGAGQGPLANGGGGGQHVNAGGAGGGNGGLGGEGGYQWIGSFGGCPFIPIGGDPGNVLAYSTLANKIFLGGGGGGGHQNNSNSTPGTHGGGIIFLRADTVEGNGFALIAAGNDQTVAATNDGAGGGGAGGVILCDIGNYGTTSLGMDVTGGRGGNCQLEHGPGGGGGGGVVWLSAPSVPGTVVLNLAGGNPGSNGAGSHGALAGASGQSILNLAVPQSTVPAAPILFSLGNDTLLCQGDSLVVDPGLSGVSYLWSTGDTTPTLTVFSTQTVWLEISTGASCTSRDTLNITFAPLPQPNLGNDTLLCQGDSLLLDPAPGYMGNFLWSTSQTNSSITVGSPGWVWVEVSDPTGTCSARDSIFLTIAPVPLVNLGPDTSICGIGPLVLDAGNPGAVYTWSMGASSQTLSVTNSGTYNVTVTYASGCQAADTIAVLFNPIPIVNLGPDQQICAGQFVTLNAGNPGSSYAWSPSISTSQTATVNATATYAVTVTTSAGCTGSDAVNITVFPAPMVNLGPDRSFCAGQSITLDAGNPGSTYSWNSGGAAQTLQVSTSGTYSVTVTNANGCTASDAVTVTVNPNPTVNLGQDRILCQGQTATLSGGNPGAAYQWSTGETTQLVQVGNPGLVWVQVTSAAGCMGQDSVNIVVNPLPIVDLGPDRILCLGDTALLDAGNPGQGFAWNTGASSQTLEIVSGGPYSVTVTDANGCKASDRMVFTERGTFTFDLGPDTIICGSPPLRLGATIPFGNYLWGDGSTVAIVPAYQSGIYSVWVDNGCHSVRDTIGVTFIESAGPFVPNAFTPNGDGNNDLFGFVGNDIADFELSVFDRWGRLIFHTQNPNQWWDGTVANQPCPEGVYAYRVQYRDCKDHLTDRGGSVTLIR